jgi:signal transduction histidine kinase
MAISNWLVPGRPNFEPYGIVPIGLSFRIPQLEAEYQAFTSQLTVVHLRFALVVAMVLVASLGVMDPFIYKKPGSLPLAATVRFAVIFLPILLCFLFTFLERIRTFWQYVGMLGICVAGCGFCMMLIIESNDQTLIHFFSATVMTILYSFFFAGLFFRYSLGAAAFVIAIFSLVIWTIDVPVATATATNIMMYTFFLLLAMAAYQKELISRQLFVSERREREALAKQHQSDARYLDWLRQLAKFLRHEVRQPVAQINSSMEIIQLASKNDARFAPYLESASLATQHVWNLVERASQATDAEAYVRQGRLQRTDLRVLLTEQVEAFGRLNSGIDLKLECRTSIIADADPILVKEAVGNLLNNAASFAAEETAVKVVLGISGAYAAIRVINKGPLIEGDTETLFGPFTSTRAHLASEHQGLGLYLVRLIAQQHGGMASISNLDDNSGVEAALFLPHTA